MFRKRSSAIRASNSLFYLKVGGSNPSASTDLYRGSSIGFHGQSNLLALIVTWAQSTTANDILKLSRSHLVEYWKRLGVDGSSPSLGASLKG